MEDLEDLGEVVVKRGIFQGDGLLSLQAWQGRKKQACGHHSPSSIQGKWLAIDDQMIKKITF